MNWFFEISFDRTHQKTLPVTTQIIQSVPFFHGLLANGMFSPMGLV